MAAGDGAVLQQAQRSQQPERAIGSVFTAPPFYAQPCTYATVVVGGATYCQCGATWYQRDYGDGDVNYVVVNPLPGY